MKVGFIGLGTMGASMASNLQRAGYELVVNDVREDAATPHLAAGAAWADRLLRDGWAAGHDEQPLRIEPGRSGDLRFRALRGQGGS